MYVSILFYHTAKNHFPCRETYKEYGLLHADVGWSLDVVVALRRGVATTLNADNVGDQIDIYSNSRNKILLSQLSSQLSFKTIVGRGHLTAATLRIFSGTPNHRFTVLLPLRPKMSQHQPSRIDRHSPKRIVPINSTHPRK